MSPLVYCLQVIVSIRERDRLEPFTFTFQKSEVSSVNILQTEDMWWGKSFIYMRKRSEVSRLYIWEREVVPIMILVVPLLGFFQEELRPFRTTLYLFFKWFSKSMINFASTPYVFDSKISPSCQTLLKVLEIFRNTPFTSFGGLQSNDLWISWVIDSSCETK